MQAVHLKGWELFIVGGYFLTDLKTRAPVFNINSETTFTAKGCRK